MEKITFWKPGTKREDDEMDIIPYNRHSQLSLEKQKMLLPISSHKEQIIHSVETNDVVIIVGQTGSGKVKNIFLFHFYFFWGEK